jgi:hypothetical protein
MKLQNFNLYSQTFAANATAGTAFTVTHGCEIDGRSVTPKAAIVTRRLSNAQLWFDTTTWTSTQATFSSDTSNAVFNVLYIA